MRLKNYISQVILLLLLCLCVESKEQEGIKEGSNIIADEDISITESFTDEQKKKIASTSESFSFQAEVSRLMDIIINSLYTQKEVFLRELISNAADALEKARFLAVSEPGYLGNQSELEIRVEIDPKQKTLTIQDTGIGMTRDDLVNNLGTVARSGTTNFLEAIAESGDLNLIGQFGVGFYSAFLVADRVTVTSKNNKDPNQHIWESMIGGSFNIAIDPRGNTLGRGTRITLHLKDDSTEFLDIGMVKTTILKFNQFVNYPIKIKTIMEEPKSEEKNKEEEDLDEASSTASPKPTKYAWETVNIQKPIWMRPKENITDEEYVEFYKALARDTEPAAYTHFSAEGEIEFKAILYIPGHTPYDSWTSYFTAKQEAIKLYARRVLVADAVYELLPKWLNFIKGVVDSDDLPLKVDRESFSQSRIIRVISKKLTAKFLELLRKLSKEDIEAWDSYRNTTKTNVTELPKTKFGKVWDAFGKNLKVGCVEDEANREKIAKISRFISTHYGKDQVITLDDYISRMPESQNSIYYISNDNYDAALNSPHMQLFSKKNIEVIVLTQPLDESCLQRLRTYDGKRLLSVEKQPEIDMSDEEKKRHKLIKKAFEPLTSVWTKHLKNKVGAVRVTHRLVEDPAAITASSYGTSAYEDRIAKAQIFATQSFMHDYVARYLDINPNHPLIKRMLELAKKSPEDPKFLEMASIVFDAAMFNSGFFVSDPTQLGRKVFKLLRADIGVSSDSKVEEYQLSPEEMKEDEDEKSEGKTNEMEDFDLDDNDDPQMDTNELLKNMMSKIKTSSDIQKDEL